MKRTLKQLLKSVECPATDDAVQSRAALEVLCDEVAHCVHAPLDSEKVAQIYSQITIPGHRALARGILATSDNADCKAFAVQLDPNLCKSCADDLMNAVRKHLETPAAGSDKKQVAHKALLYAQDWYARAGALTAELDKEIQSGLVRTTWVNQ